MFKTVTIGDTHGRIKWRYFADIGKMLDEKEYTPKYDKYIFTGDYVDSWSALDNTIIEQLNYIIKLKQKYPSHVVLLIGNHDLQYMFEGEFRCSGYREHLFTQLNKIYNDNIHLFQPCYKYADYLWTHAGISGEFYERYIKGIKCPYIEQIICSEYKNHNSHIFDVGFTRGGANELGGIFWADICETKHDLVDGLNQVIGHSTVQQIDTWKGENSRNIYVDCANKEALFLNLNNEN
jgi:hypothetical protein